MFGKEANDPLAVIWMRGAYAFSAERVVASTIDVYFGVNVAFFSYQIFVLQYHSRVNYLCVLVARPAKARSLP